MRNFENLTDAELLAEGCKLKTRGDAAVARLSSGELSPADQIAGSLLMDMACDAMTAIYEACQLRGLDLGQAWEDAGA